jgi:hypothetical protein
VIAWLLANPADEGRRVITGMLLVGLVFVLVIAFGEVTHSLRHRRKP